MKIETGNSLQTELQFRSRLKRLIQMVNLAAPDEAVNFVFDYLNQVESYSKISSFLKKHDKGRVFKYEIVDEKKLKDKIGEILADYRIEADRNSLRDLILKKLKEKESIPLNVNSVAEEILELLIDAEVSEFVPWPISVESGKIFLNNPTSDLDKFINQFLKDPGNLVAILKKRRPEGDYDFIPRLQPDYKTDNEKGGGISEASKHPWWNDPDR